MFQLWSKMKGHLVQVLQWKTFNLHCLKRVQIQSYLWSLFSWIGLNTGKYGLEITPYLDTLHAVLKLVSAIFLKLIRYIKFKNVDEIATMTNVYLYGHYQKTKTLCRHVFIYCFRLSEASSFRTKKINRCHKLVTSRLF